MTSNDEETWRFPAVRGRLRGHNLGFHFVDATDDVSDTKLDLLFEGDRLYLHGAQGFFGAVPLSLTGASSLRTLKGHFYVHCAIKKGCCALDIICSLS